MDKLEFPSNWIIVSLGEVCEIVGGGTPSRENQSYFNGNIPWATPSDVTKLNDIWLKDTSEHITEEGLKRSNAKLLPIGTVLMTSRASIGFTAITTQELTTNQGFANLICKDQIISNVYLAFWLRLIRDKLNSIAGGTTFKEISKSTLSTLQIPLPPLSEQDKIVEMLREADNLIQLRKQSDKKINQFILASFVKIFGNPDPRKNNKGWEIIKLGDYIEVGTGGTPNRNNSANFGGEYSWVKTTELKDSLITSTEETLTAHGLKSSNASVFPKNTILLAMYGQGQTRGRTGKLNIPASTNQACAAFLPSKDITPDYLWFLLRASYERIRELGQGGVRSNLNLSIVKDLQIPKPPIRLQNEFEKLVSFYQTQLELNVSVKEKLEMLKASVFASAFTGKLTASWRNKETENLQKEIVERNILLKELSEKTNLTTKHEDKEEQKPKHIKTEKNWVIEQFSPKQKRILELAQSQKTYIEPKIIFDDLNGNDNISLTDIEQTLELLSQNGLIKRVRIKTVNAIDGETIFFAPSFRVLKQNDRSKKADLELIQQELFG